jgi:hypothetical protein
MPHHSSPCRIINNEWSVELCRRCTRAGTINSKEFVKDIRSGMIDLEMGEKYGLTVHDFDRVLEYLVDAELISKGEQLERQHLSDSQIIRAFVESCEDVRIVD